MRHGAIASLVVGLTLIVPASAHANDTACRSADARRMLRDAGQGFNGRVIEIHDDRLLIEAESRYDEQSIAFGEKVTVYGRGLPATPQGRIGIVVRRMDGSWHATRCDVIPGARMANALTGGAPCPAPRVRIAGVTVEGLTVSLRLRLAGDATGLRVYWGNALRRRTFEPGFTYFVEQHRFRAAGRRLIRVRVFGGTGPGCGRARRSSATARRTVDVV